MANFRIPGPTLWGAQFSQNAGSLFNLRAGFPGQDVCSTPLTTAFHLLPVQQSPGMCLAGMGQFNAAPDVSFLFRMCLNPRVGLTDQDFADAAAGLGVEVAAIKAVAEVEAPGKAFDESGRPRILYERHYFHRLTQGRYDKQHPDISNTLGGGYGKFSAQYGKLEKAYLLDAEAALKSASWGRFQIMGENHPAAGYSSVQAFVLALTRSEAAHLQAFTRFVMANNSMNEALRKKEWAAFAKAYNGKNYQQNDYDTKLKSAYDKFTRGSAKP